MQRLSATAGIPQWEQVAAVADIELVLTRIQGELPADGLSHVIRGLFSFFSAFDQSGKEVVVDQSGCAEGRKERERRLGEQASSGEGRVKRA